MVYTFKKIFICVVSKKYINPLIDEKILKEAIPV
jgi:hypothetical protein